MKRILLASASVVAFAGAAKADFDISGSATIGWNDKFNESNGYTQGYYNDFDFDINFSQELDYGVTAAARLGFEYVDSDGNAINNGHSDFGSFTDDNFLLSLTADMGSLYFGHTDFAAQTYWDGVTNMETDDFSEADGETVLRGELAYGNITMGVSGVVHNNDFAGDNPNTPLTTTTTTTPAVTAPVLDAAGNPTGQFVVITPATTTTTTTGIDETGQGTGELDQFSFGAIGTFGAFTFSAAYQQEADKYYNGNNDDFVRDRVYGVAVGGTFAGAEVTLAYSDHDGDGTSTGLEVTYPVGPVSLKAFYVMNNGDTTNIDDNYGIEASYSNGPIAVSARYHDGQDEETAVEASFGLGNGLMLFAGYIDERENGYTGLDQAEIYYVAAQADLGGGAALLISYADVNDGPGGHSTDLDGIGANDYLVGTTVALTLDF